MGINEKEFAVIREISNNQKPTQRHIAKKIGISLGLTNLIIRRLIKKGYIKIQEAPPRTIIYSLTPKGFSEKTKKSYHFTLRTIDLMKNIKENIKDIIMREYRQGVKDFIISGEGELATFTEIVFRDLNLKDGRYIKIENKSKANNQHCYLTVIKNGTERKIDILLELSKQGVHY